MGKREVNNSICKRIREIRISRNFTAVEVARRSGIPSSSYAHMEYGTYRIHSDELFRILEALGADITDVWPTHTKSLQKFRIREICSLSESTSAALFVKNGELYEPILSYGVNGQQLRRLSIYISDGIDLAAGLLCYSAREGLKTAIYLEAPKKDEFTRFLAKKFLSRFQSHLLRDSARGFALTPDHEGQSRQVLDVSNLTANGGF